jgi:hypothetical protein
MDEIAIFCKSYRRDLDRCAGFVESLFRHNRDELPFYLSVPARDRRRFEARLGTGRIRYLADEEVMGSEISQSWVTQQLVKLRFARLGLAHNYVWFDSDFVMLRDFSGDELFAYPGVPYTVVFEARSDVYYERMLGEPEADPEYARMLAGVSAAHAVVRDWFGRTGPLYFYGAPAIWSCQVVQALEVFLRERGSSFEAMLARAPYEMSWYGEFLLAHRTIPVVPRGSLAVCFTRDQQYERFLAHGFTLEAFAARGYLAANFAAKWMGPRHGRAGRPGVR